MRDIQTLDWKTITHSLNERGYAHIPEMLHSYECTELKEEYKNDQVYRATIDMQRYRFGKGEYKYFAYPLPAIIQNLRSGFYSQLALIANQWMDQLGIERKYPDNHTHFIQYCHEQKQIRPTALILRYDRGGYNTLHQDLYGEVYFPFQVVLMLSQHGEDYQGGEFVLIEQVPRAQSRAQIVRLGIGDALIFATNFRPVRGTRGFYKASIKHGVSEVSAGERYALGVIFHDAA